MLPLMTHLPHHTKFSEPCAGDGQLVWLLESWGHECVWKSDIQPGDADTACLNVLNTTGVYGGDCFITNPPWARPLLHQIIPLLSNIAPTWLLFDADWMHTIQATPYLPHCRKIVSVGRVKWFPGTHHESKDNAAWYLFEKDESVTEFIGR